MTSEHNPSMSAEAEEMYKFFIVALALKGNLSWLFTVNLAV